MFKKDRAFTDLFLFSVGGIEPEPILFPFRIPHSTFRIYTANNLYLLKLALKKPERLFIEDAEFNQLKRTVGLVF